MSVSRRTFVMTTLITGITRAVARAATAPINTDTNGLAAGEAQIPVSDGHLPAYFAKPQGAGPFPVVLVIEEIFGVHDYIKDVCRRLAKLGYMAVAPELYARIGDPSQYTDHNKIMTDIILKAPDGIMLTDLDSTLLWAVENGGDGRRTGVTGFCRGGRDAWLYAEHSPKLKAAVAWYGPVKGPVSEIQPHTPTELAASLHCPLLGLYGGKDTSISQADVQVAAHNATDAGHQVNIVVFPDAGHGFHADYRESYNQADAEKGWALMLDWFRKNGVA